MSSSPVDTAAVGADRLPGETVGARSMAAMIDARHNVAPRRLIEPGPSDSQLRTLFEAAACAPDHQQLLPWRFVVVPAARRGALADAFAQALLERDPAAGPEQVEAARDKAFRSPMLALAIVRLASETPESSPEVGDAERLVSLGAAIQNMLLMAQAQGFSSGLVSGQALDSRPLRELFALGGNEKAVCFVNVGTPKALKPPRGRPAIERFVSSL